MSPISRHSAPIKAYRCVKTVVRSVSPLQDFLLILEGVVDHDGTEHFLDVDPVGILDVGEDGGFDVCAVVVATDGEGGTGLLSLLDEARDGGELSGIGDCSEECLDVGRVSLLLGPAGEVALEVLQEHGGYALFDVETGVGLQQRARLIRDHFPQASHV